MPPAAPPHRREPSRARRSLSSLFAVITLGVLGFLGATVYVETRASAIDRETVLIETNSLPSVELLSTARAALWRMEVAAHEIVEEEGEPRREASVALERARREVSRSLESELAAGAYPGETELHAAVVARLADLDGHTAMLRQALAERGLGDEKQLVAHASHEMRADIGRVDEGIQQILALNAGHGHEQLGRIAQIRRDSLRLLFVLNGTCLALLGAGAWISLRSVKRQRDVELAHEAMLESRSSELERFASRVAHDLLSPLSALHFTLVTVQRNADRGLPISEALERAWSCLRRSRGLVEGVMDFARSGARPTGGRANLGAIVEGVLEEARDAAGDVAFRVDGVQSDTFLACSAGVLTSVLSNLVGNAVKHFGATPDKVITIRAIPEDAMVRVEVEDNGPGLPPELQNRVFEPYVRAPESRTPGLGLGLATVMRFVESHSGRAGVRSAPTRGCVFWFSLPIEARGLDLS